MILGIVSVHIRLLFIIIHHVTVRKLIIFVFVFIIVIAIAVMRRRFAAPNIRRSRLVPRPSRGTGLLLQLAMALFSRGLDPWVEEVFNRLQPPNQTHRASPASKQPYLDGCQGVNHHQLIRELFQIGLTLGATQFESHTAFERLFGVSRASRFSYRRQGFRDVNSRVQQLYHACQGLPLVAVQSRHQVKQADALVRARRDVPASKHTCGDVSGTIHKASNSQWVV